ncbi:hypothetical protein A2U01_0085478, partial [Trifolium medium]|nr:hypothetical protein [Trifolium medium]
MLKKQAAAIYTPDCASRRGLARLAPQPEQTQSCKKNGAWRHDRLRHDRLRLAPAAEQH